MLEEALLRASAQRQGWARVLQRLAAAASVAVLAALVWEAASLL